MPGLVPGLGDEAAAALAHCMKTLDRVAAVMPTARVGVAVSGGSDSLALLTMAVGWARTHGVALEAATVDHGLRSESRREAEAVGAYCASWFLPHAILTWSPPASRRGLPAAARAGRYALLADWMRARGLSVLLVGHTADDRLETQLMREAKGGRDIAALRAAAVYPLWPEGRGVTVIRPLLAVRRASLRALLSVLGIDWLDDPSNTDPASPRIRAREKIAGWSDELVDRMLADVTARDAEAARAEAHALIRVMADLTIAPTGALYLGNAVLAACDPALDRILARLLAIAAGAPSGPGGTAAGRLRRAMAEPRFSGATLGGAMVTRRGARLILARDPGAVLGRRGRVGLPPKALAAGCAAVWDGRFLIETDRDIVIRPWGPRDPRALRQDQPAQSWQGPDSAAAPAAETSDGACYAGPVQTGPVRFTTLAEQRLDDWSRALRILNADLRPSASM